MYFTYGTIVYVTGQGATIKTLPKGPHDLSREQVRTSQRIRMLEAILNAIGEYGYVHANVKHVTDAAHVSKSAFYQQFTDKQDAFLQAYDDFSRRLVNGLADVGATAETPLAAIDACGDFLVHWCRDRPIAFRAFLLEIYAAGEPGLQRRDQFIVAMEDLFAFAAARMRHLDPTLPPHPPFIARAVVAACVELCAQALRHPSEQAFQDARQAVTHIWLLGLTVGFPSYRGDIALRK